MIKLNRTIIWILIFLSPVLRAQQSNSALLDSIIKSSEFLNKIILARNTYSPQIIYTQINRDADNVPSFLHHYYLTDTNTYFYCASLVKLPTSIFALEKLNQLNKPGLDKNSIMFNDKVSPCQQRMWADPSSANGYPSVAHHIKKMLLVSDNESFNRMYEFVTPRYMNSRLSSLGYHNARILHNFDVKCLQQPGIVPAQVRFLNSSKELLYKQKEDSMFVRKSPNLKRAVVGRDIRNRKGKLLSEKKDFTWGNTFPLETIHSILQNLIFMPYLPKDKQYNITKEDREFLIKHLGMYPRESRYPKYDSLKYIDSHKKYFIYGATQQIINSDSIRIYNIVGQSYGFLIDCAYIVNYTEKTEFMVSSAIYVNKRNSFGNGTYEYNELGFPFLKELSLALYRFEKTRKKKYIPIFEAVNLKE
jgi:hypothetical protein